MYGRKRPAAPRSRGNSPPSQRRRQSEQSSITDRYANTAHPGVLPSPPHSRKTSAAGLAANMRTGSTPHSTNQRHVDQHRQNINRDALQGLERVQNSGGQASSRKPSADHSPRHVASPMVSRSGSNTPVHVAPVVPSVLPVTRKPVAGQNAPMNTLSEIRLHKASLAASVAQGMDGSGNREVKVLKAQLKAAQMQEGQLRSDLKKFESQLNQLEALPAQLAALKNLVEQLQQEVAKGPSPQDAEARLSALENAKPAVDTALFADLQPEVQAMKTEAKKLDHVPEQLKELQATVTQHGKEIAETRSRNDEIKVEVDALTSIKEDVKTIKKQQIQGQAMKGEAIKTVAQAAIQPEVVKWEAFQTKHEKIVNELRAREGTPSHTAKHPVDPTDFEDLRESVCGLGEDKEKLAKDVHDIRTVIGELQQKSQTDSAQEMHMGLLDSHKNLAERVTELEAASGRSALPALSTSHDQLEERVEGVCKSQKILRAGHDTLVDQFKTSEDAQTRLSKELNAMVDQFKAFQHEQASLSKEHKAFVDQSKSYSSEQKSLQTQQKAYQTKQDELSEEQTRLRQAVESLDSRVTAPDGIVDQVDVLATAQTNASIKVHNVSLRVTALETAQVPAAHKTYSAGNEPANTASSSSIVDELEQRLRSVENHIGGADGLSMRCDKIQDDIEDCQSNVDLIQKSFVGIFSKVFDPFKESVEGRLEEHAQSFTHLQGKMEELQRECPAATFSAPQLALIHSTVQDAADATPNLSRLQEYVRIKAEQQNAAIEELKQDLAMKQDMVTTTQAIDVVKAAVRSLQQQYENISTDDLHQKMVHWFTQNYASPSAKMCQQWAAIHHEVTQLRKFTDGIARIPNSAQTLSRLAQLGPQLEALVRTPPASNEESPERLAKIDESLNSMSDSVAQAHKRYDGLAKVVGNLQTSMHSLNSDNTPFVRAERLAAVEKSIATLEGHSDNEQRARKEFETKASREHDQRIHAEASIKTSIQDLLSTSNEKFRELDQFHSDFNEIFNKFNDPKTKELFAWLPVLFLHVGQLQWVLEKLNQSLPKGGFEIEWTSDWKDEFSVPSPFPRRNQA